MIVTASGPPNAELVIIGEAPGAEEERLGQPFVGASGYLLDQVLGTAGLNRQQCWITNLLKVRPRNNEIKTVPKPDLDLAKLQLRNELSVLTNAKLYVPVGNYALWALCNEMDISKRRGSPIRAWNGTPCIPTIHPAATFREPSFAPLLYLDFQRVALALQELDKLFPPRNLILNPTDDFIAFWINDCRSKRLPLSFDIETQGDQITCISFANNAQSAISFYLDSVHRVRLADTILSDPTVPKIGQNFQYDTLVLERSLGIVVCGHWLDTLLMHHILEPELPHSLAFLTSMYTWEPYYKNELHEKVWSHRQNRDQLLQYNAKDAVVTWEIAKIELDLLNEQPELYNLYFDSVLPQWHALMSMTRRGVLLDESARQEYHRFLTCEINDQSNRINDWSKTELNINSNKQLIQFFTQRRYRLVIDRKTHNPTFDKNALGKLRLQARTDTDRNAIDTINAVRKNLKLRSTYAECRPDSDGYIRSAYNQATVTGRLSSRSVPWGNGMNLQNIPRTSTDSGYARRMFIPSPGNVFIEADYSQAEARIVAYCADCQPLIAIFNSGGDVHRLVASMLFQKSPEDVTTFERELAKRVVHGGNYGMGPQKLCEIAALQGFTVTLEQARRSLALYFDVFPEIRAEQEQTIKKLQTDRTLTTPFGRSRTFYQRLDGEYLNDALSYIPQSTIADLTNRSLHAAWAEGIDVVLQVHDAIVVESPTERVNEVSVHLKSMMERPINRVGQYQNVIVPVDLKTGPNWGELTKLDI